MDVARVDAPCVKCVDEELPLLVGTHGTGVGGVHAHPPEVYGNVDRVSPRILPALLFVHVDAVITRGGNLHDDPP